MCVLPHQGTLGEFDQQVGNEPACVEEHWPGVEDTQHEKEGQEVEDRTEWPNEDHQVVDQADVPMLRLIHKALIHVVAWDGHLGVVVE